MGGATRFFVLLSTPLPLIHHHRRPSFLRLASHYHNFFRSSLKPRNRFLSPSFPLIRASRHVHSQVSTPGDEFGNFEESGSVNGVFSPDSYIWREWSNFLGSLDSGGYFGSPGSGNEFVAVQELPAEFVNAANACLAFSRGREHLLGLLPRRDIEVLVESVNPCLFRDGDASLRKMKLFLQGDETQVLDSDKARTIDLFKFILSYARNPTVSSESNLYSRDQVESSMRNLLSEICKLCFSNPDPKLLETDNQFSDKYSQSRGPYGPKVEMKRGDWICPRCSFMNFARNVKCLECEEARPKRQLIGGEWECPQCDFFNYGRNTVCLRCDCKRPGPPSLSNININSGLGNDNGSHTIKVDIDSKLAANEEKAQRWFSKISQLDSTSDSGSSITDEDFPEIMPLRKGVNRFVVSTRKTPLERRLANAQYRRNLGNDGVPENNSSELSASNNSLDKTTSHDDILGRLSTNSQSTNFGNEQGIRTNYTLSSTSGSSQYESPKGGNSSYVPFVPLPPDMFAKKPKNSSMESEVVGTDNNKSLPSSSNEWTGSTSQSNGLNEVGDIPSPPQNPTQKINEGKEETEKSERWFKRVAELHNVTDLPSAISDEDFPEIMPMRKGENRFVVSKKKDRSLTSPAYKRRAAMEQAGSSNFVPFVPFPPDYFAKKDKALSDDSNSQVTETFSDDSNGQVTEAQSYDTSIGIDDRSNSQQSDNLETQAGRFNSELHTRNSSRSDEATAYGVPNIQSLDTNLVSSQPGHKNVANNNTSVAGNPSPASEMPNVREKWSGKSLEGSAVTEPDPLDMSEEAKVQRWFRRVAQIKDISELSQIPDEDFPSIMPMRKGVNRFVVSKRKTPLERRLTSPQYRRNLPIVSSDPPKRENDGS
ncbi:zinc finger protein VAR3, chloroplastic [Cucurbita moschata]|uniref:Zinc finger protein VAR3, chloroplastic n=1 Tax=Cucurbita moschata TaxID=3662 RepID=A0A6J1FU33_CUCMO|nr:zinc finger protein VAR3, chloroplastic [Cucurbita moschata]